MEADAKIKALYALPLPKGKVYATEGVWNCHRGIITRLYRNENRTLKEVMEIMERDYCFYATERMFKTRIKKWGLDKKIKETEVLAMLEIQRQRAADGKKSCFTVRNQNVERGRITRYLKRRPDLQKRLHTISHQYLKPTHEIICRTPSPADSPQVPLIPEMHLHEDILRILRNYLDGAFQGRFWVVMGQEIYGPGKLESRQRLDEWYCSMGAVRELLSHQNANTAFAILDRLMNLIGCMIKDQDPELLYHLCYHFVRLQSDPAQAELSESLNLFICKMHNVILGDQNCLSLIWSKLVSLNKKARVEAISTMFTFSARYFKDQISLSNGTAAWIHSTQLAILDHLEDKPKSVYQHTLYTCHCYRRCFQETGRHNGSFRWLQRVAGYQMKLGDAEAARVTMKRANCLMEAKINYHQSSWKIMQFWYHRHMGDFYDDLGQGAETARCYVKAYEWALEMHGPTSEETLLKRKDLINFLRGIGDVENQEDDRWCNILLAELPLFVTKGAQVWK